MDKIPIKLTSQTKLEIIPTLPFHFDTTFYKPAHFPSRDTKWEPGKRWQTMLWKSKQLGLIFEDAGADKKPRVLVKIFSANKLTEAFLQSLKTELIWRFNLGLNLSEFYQAVDQGLQLAPVIKKFYGLRPMHPGSLYEYLIIAIVLQNATVKRSVYMLQALFENYGSLLRFDQQDFWCFWEPKALARANEQKLRDLKMGYRAKSLIKVSTPLAKGEIDESTMRAMIVEEQEKILLSLYGIGPASVGYIMFDVFHQWGYLKYISPWEQKIYTQIFFDKNYEKELVPVDKMLKYFEKWDTWKNLAIHYVWEDLWWKRKHESIPWLEKLMRL